MRKSVRRVAGLMLLSLAVAAAQAGAWGDAPTHFSLNAENAVRKKFEQTFDPGLFPLFVQAAAGPDLAWTLLFQASGRTYVHDEAFVAALEHVARRPQHYLWKKSWKSTWRVIAAAWRAHHAADRVAHGEYVPDRQPQHSLVEAAVDTCVFYGKPVPEELGDSWRDVNLTEEACDPALLYWASWVYTKGKLPVFPWMTREALRELQESINRSYELSESQGGPQRAEKLLKLLVPGKSWETYYDASVTAIVDALP